MSATILLILVYFSPLVCGDRDNRLISTLRYSKNYVQPTVVNGLPARYGQVPYLVSFKERLIKVSRLKYIWTNICGGSIIHPRKVLTAAHCFEGKDFFFKKHPEFLRAVAGEFSTELIHTGNTDTTQKSQWRKIVKVVLHNRFFFPENDIAIAFIDVPFVYNANVGYVLTAQRRTDYRSNCIAAGFGSIDQKDDKISPVLLVANMFLLPRRNCSLVWEMNMDRFICTYSFMSDVGRGDSGGPLACRDTLDPTERRKKGSPLLVGVVSGKNFDKTSLFTRVSHYKGWIKRAGNTGIQVLKSRLLVLVVAFCIIINHRL